MPRFEQIGNLYRCRDAEMAKEGDDGGSGSLRILARPWFHLLRMYIYLFTCCGSSRDLYGNTKEETERVESGNRFVACRY